MSVRVRFAPSPTGHLHVGNARTALFNWLFARGRGGRFVLRIEDTDTERELADAERSIFRDLAWLGLDWDEGPVPFDAALAGEEGPDGGGAPPAGASQATGCGDLGPYRQSERAEAYDAAYRRLLDAGLAYPCFCSEDQLAQDRAECLAAGRTPGYAGRCGALSERDARARLDRGEPYALRLRVPGYGVVQDILRGEIDFRSRPAFDAVIRRRDGRPTYNFAVVVDDAAMAITHVLRGEDHLTNTALQLRLYEGLAVPPPAFGHLPLILGPDGAPLSKRHGAASVGDVRALGVPPEALVNALALLGWTPADESVLMDSAELVSRFDLSRISPSPAIFDIAKLDWISGQKIRGMNPVRRGDLIGEALRGAGLLDRVPEEAQAWLERVGEMLATSLTRFTQAPDLLRSLLEYEVDRARRAGATDGPRARLALETFAALLERGPGVRDGDVPALVEEARRTSGLKGRELLHPLRVAVTAAESGPELSRLLPLVDEAARLGLRPGLPGNAERIRRVLEGG